MVSNLAGSAHGRRGFFHGVANRGDDQTGVNLGGLQGLVVQNPAKVEVGHGLLAASQIVHREVRSAAIPTLQRSTQVSMFV